MAENGNFIFKMLEEVSLSYIAFHSEPHKINIKIYRETLDKLVMLFCLVTHTILNNAGNDRSIHYDSPSDEQTELQGKILATCIKLIEYDLNFTYDNVLIESFVFY